MKPFGAVAWRGPARGGERALAQPADSQVAAGHSFGVLVCFWKQLQNFALGDIFFALVCSATNLLLSEYFERKALL